MHFSAFFLATVAGLVACTAAAPTKSQSQVVLPAPTGYYQVGRSVIELIDHSRTQPFAPDTEPRKLMISVFYPVIPQHPTVPTLYFPLKTARVEDRNLSASAFTSRTGPFERLALHLAESSKPYKNLTHQPTIAHPLVMFMPAEGTTRLFYSAMLSTLASTGYIVVSVDAPYDVDVVQYPDGSLAFINGTAWGNPNQTALAETAYLAVQTRVEDVSFVLDSLSNATLAHSLVPRLPASGLNTAHTAMFGHSLGGATSFSILAQDARVRGGLNLDGGLFGPGLAAGTSKPFMLVGHANHTRTNAAADPLLTWEKVWPVLTGWKRDVVVADTLHYDFSDYPIVFDALGLNPGAKVKEDLLLLGSMGGKRALNVVTSYVGAFLDFVLLGKGSALLEGPVAEFPEVTFEY